MLLVKEDVEISSFEVLGINCFYFSLVFQETAQELSELKLNTNL